MRRPPFRCAEWELPDALSQATGSPDDDLSVTDTEQIIGILRHCAGKLRGDRTSQGKIRYRLWEKLNSILARPADQGRNEQRRAKPSRLENWLTDMANRMSGPLGALLSSALTLIWFLSFTGLPSWFVRQPFMNSGKRGIASSFKGKLAAGEWKRQQDQREVCLLLVHTFLEDLRRAYRWRLRPRMHGRRMTYPVLLLSGATRDNGGHVLLSLIREVRDRTRRFDPLLVIGFGPPPSLAPESGQWWPDDTPRGAYNAWCARFQKSPAPPSSWYLRLRAPDPVLSPEHQRHLVQTPSVPETDRPRWWLAAKYQLACASVALIAGVISGHVLYDSYEHTHCGIGWLNLHSVSWWHPSSWINHDLWSLRDVKGECIGVTDGTYQFTPIGNTPLTLLTVERKIGEQNQAAAGLERQYHRSRPLITIVYLGWLTSLTADDLSAEREELEGVAAAQYLLNKRGQDFPIMRVLIANAGSGMQQGTYVAGLIARYAARDPSIVGVVGLDQSREPTFLTIQALASTKLPVIAATLSADQLAGEPGIKSISPQYYFQVAPQNSQEAEFAARFAQANFRAQRSAQIYYSSDRSDEYSSNLAGDAAAAFRQSGFNVLKARSFRPSNGPDSGTAYNSGLLACKSPHTLVFYAGRDEDFQYFLAGIETCAPATPTIIGDDDVARFVANPEQPGAFSNIPFYYVSFTTGQPSCANGTGQTLAGAMRQLFPFDCDTAYQALVDGHAALTYDDAETIITAAEYVQASQDTVTRAAILRAIDVGHGDFTGASGKIIFGGTPNPHVPSGKVIVMEAAEGSTPPHPVAFCDNAQPQVNLPVTGNSSLTQRSWCKALGV